ncbi:MAG TPA: D-glycero-beta-D-manno-heptose-7-phosphate kinase [Deltaproteobacteria bacterium]|nr:D-glycero-beta-D-manno-heptose-7-phosphate kinase [Deltaproteobacteria bacterium]HIJ37129.1 D-glycero-beta-D-manno-heptose-7-phosphate kinase [Deltaproteobacteria bacterium]HIJ41536.1 D-glycero-beta-D-manno-heptose-7-phosphate kinase [Deltaproteobacteria bacterium]
MAEINGNYYQSDILKAHIDRFPGAKVFVIGDIIMDRYIWGNVSRISPEAPVPVVDVKMENGMLGGAANVIRNIAALGARPVLCGVVGKDETGEEILSEIEKMGLKKDGIVTEDSRITSVKTRVVAHNQQVVRFDRESRKEISPTSIKNILSYIEENLAEIDAIVISDYGKGVISGQIMNGLTTLIGPPAKRTIILSVDPKTGNFEYYQGVDIITPNHHEAGLFCGIEIVDEETLLRAGKAMLDHLHCRSVLITQGKDGMTLFEKAGEITHIPTVAKKVFDVTGAGDTVIGTISLALASGLDLKSAAILSNFAAGIVVGEVGTSAVNAKDLKEAIGK